MDREVTKADLMTAESCGTVTFNDIRNLLNDKVSADEAEKGMNVILEATKDMTSAQRIAAATFVVMKEMLDVALEVGDADISN